jgi:UDP-2,3-diacylglucosamine hydrolase
MGKIHAIIDDADIIVLNGDIFDFRWSHYPDHETTVYAAVEWLEELVSLAPDSEFRYVMGNHDTVSDFVPFLDQLSDKHAGFYWHEFTWQYQDILFLHGDAIHSRMSHDQFLEYRNAWKADQQRSKTADRLYDAASAAGLINLIHKLGFPERKSVTRMSAYLESTGLNKGINKVYFGHTHVAINGIDYKGIRYFNCGAAMKGTPFNVLKVV